MGSSGRNIVPGAFWTIFHFYWAFITVVICWRWLRQPLSPAKGGMLLLGVGALLSNALFLYADFAGNLWQT
jgi:hypothetical protein